MKVRTDFVSNSSSTSYAVELNNKKSIEDFLNLYKKKDFAPEEFEYVFLNRRTIRTLSSKLADDVKEKMKKQLKSFDEPFYDSEMTNGILTYDKPITNAKFLRVNAPKFFKYVTSTKNDLISDGLKKAITIIYCNCWVDMSYWEHADDDPYKKLTTWLFDKKIIYEYPQVHD